MEPRRNDIQDDDSGTCPDLPAGIEHGDVFGKRARSAILRSGHGMGCGIQLLRETGDELTALS
jgi:hypothetical protein